MLRKLLPFPLFQLGRSKETSLVKGRGIKKEILGRDTETKSTIPLSVITGSSWRQDNTGDICVMFHSRSREELTPLSVVLGFVL